MLGLPPWPKRRSSKELSDDLQIASQDVREDGVPAEYAAGFLCADVRV